MTEKPPTQRISPTGTKMFGSMGEQLADARNPITILRSHAGKPSFQTFVAQQCQVQGPMSPIKTQDAVLIHVGAGSWSQFMAHDCQEKFLAFMVAYRTTI